MDNYMFCFQCQETVDNKGCTMIGVCGKMPHVAAAQDLLIYVTKGLSAVTTELRSEGKTINREVNRLVTKNLYMTVTNTNFDLDAVMRAVSDTLRTKERLLRKLRRRYRLPEAAHWSGGEAGYMAKAATVGIGATEDEDLCSLRELITYGLKGLAAYMTHANALHEEDEEIDAFIQSTLAKLLDDSLTTTELLSLALETGKFGMDGMALLNKANTETYGTPVITTVPLSVRSNPGILVSGHDFHDLEMLLEQSAGSGVDIYTHGEMLPAHYYPAFSHYPHFAGNYGNAWWQQAEEFDKFNGPILMTSNCLMPPKKSYEDRLWTTGPTGISRQRHIIDGYGGARDFTPIIEQAKLCAAPTSLENGTVTGGFGYAQVFALEDRLVKAVADGDIRKFVVLAGCDGRYKSREYYTEYAEKLPEDVVILTAGCLKYRFNKLDLGHIGGIPRVLDAGQCNDAYSLALIALKLKELFEVEDLNDLPIVYNIAWYEQKAIIVLLALLSIGVKNIRLGPTLPAFLSPNIAEILKKYFNISTIGTAEEDLKQLLG